MKSNLFTLAHTEAFKKWMAIEGFAKSTQEKYPYYLNRYCTGFQRTIDETSLASEADVTRIRADVERAVVEGGRGAGEFNLHVLKNNLLPAMHAYIQFVADRFLSMVANDVPVEELPPRLKIEVLRLMRDTKMAREIKALHEHTCQVCGLRLELSPGQFYSEGHHLKPLGNPHNGPDVKDNILCVCPNCHAKLDFAAIKIDPKKLRTVPGHSVRQEFIDYHNRLKP